MTRIQMDVEVAERRPVPSGSPYQWWHLIVTRCTIELNRETDRYILDIPDNIDELIVNPAEGEVTYEQNVDNLHSNGLTPARHMQMLASSTTTVKILWTGTEPPSSAPWIPSTPRNISNIQRIRADLWDSRPYLPETITWEPPRENAPWVITPDDGPPYIVGGGFHTVGHYTTPPTFTPHHRATRNLLPESEVIDEIDRLVNDQIRPGPQDDYQRDRYDKCTDCGHDWHGLECDLCSCLNTDWIQKKSNGS